MKKFVACMIAVSLISIGGSAFAEQKPGDGGLITKKLKQTLPQADTKDKAAGEKSCKQNFCAKGQKAK